MKLFTCSGCEQGLFSSSRKHRLACLRGLPDCIGNPPPVGNMLFFFVGVIGAGTNKTIFFPAITCSSCVARDLLAGLCTLLKILIFFKALQASVSFFPSPFLIHKIQDMYVCISC